jgi:uncharacterized protein YgiM (DUF1202 family)
VAAIAGAATAAEFSPYEARVVATGASVHSGPGDKFYPTDTLAQGDVVEVYQEKSAGWLAIRPPVNSFSWVAARDLKLIEGGTAEVVADGAASRIGSRLSANRNAAQVRLKKGEVVDVLDEETIGDEKWYKISPPDGEFRWIQATLVERLGTIQMASAESTAPIDATPTEAKADAAPPPLIPTSPAAGASQPISNTPASTRPNTALPSTSTAAADQPAATAPIARPVAAGPVADELSRELAAIELRLSRMVAAPINLWNTERLERDAAQLLTRAQSTAERDAVQVTLNKIRQFSAIGQRSNQLPAMAATTTGQPATASTPGAPNLGPTALPVAAAPSGAAAAIAGAPAAAGASPFDAVGILRPVVSRRPGAPQFALVDDRGQVLSFVTPSPDVNLQPYLGRRVGVTGSRGFIAEFNRNHVTAARVSPITGGMVR